jgi:predicted N-acetyltransferase YhbS
VIEGRSCDSDADVTAVRELLLRPGRVTTPGFVWDPRRWDGSRFYRPDPGLDPDWAGRVRLWEVDGRVVGCVHPEDGADAWIEVEPGYRHLEPSMLEWAEEYLADDGALVVHALDGDGYRRGLLAGRGYVETEEGEVTRIRSLVGAARAGSPSLAAGYRLREIDSSEVEDRWRLADLLNAAFGRHGHGEAEFATFARMAPGYRDDLHLVAVAPDGAFAAHVGLTWEPRLGLAVLEPVCTHPDHRRLGLAAALIEEGIARVARLGAELAMVGTGIHADANRLYVAAGFELASEGRFWRRKAGASATGPGLCGEVPIDRVERRVGGGIGGSDPFEREVVEGAVVAHVLHVAPAGRIERMQQSIGLAVELEREDAEPLTQAPVEGRRGLQPAVVERQLDIAMPEEEVGAESLEQLGSRQMVAHVGEPQASGDPPTAGDRCQEHRLGDAEAVPAA